MLNEITDFQKKKVQFYEILKEKKIKPVYQPIVSLKDGKILGYEALSRIDREDCCFGVEEMFELARILDEAWELEEICREKSISGAKGKLHQKKLFLNVSPEIVKDEKFKVGVTAEYLKDNEMQAEDIIFEITERTAIRDCGIFLAALEHYQKQNYKIAIDDMGSGYSGLNRICKLEPDYVKVDMELVRGIHKDYLKESIVESFARFCSKTGIRLIAEGIETAEELKTLIKIGVEFGQGYFLERPAEEMSLSIPQKTTDQICRLIEKRKKHQLQPSFFGSVDTVCTKSMTVAPLTLGYDIFQEFEKNENLTECCVVDLEGKVHGVLTRAGLFKLFGGRFGFNMNGRRTAGELADRDYLAFESDTPIENVSKLALKRDVWHLYDAVIIMEQDRYIGVATVKNLLEAAVSIQVKRAVDSNPLTGLPGNIEIEKRVKGCIKAEEPFSIIYLDLDNFKAYNDAYGFNNGDQMIRMLADITGENCGEEAFLGHIGGDDFVLIVQNWKMQDTCLRILEKFEEDVKQLYNREDLKNGYIRSKNRNGFEDTFPIASVSIAVITNKNRRYENLDELSGVIARAKKKSKAILGNSYIES